MINYISNSYTPFTFSVNNNNDSTDEPLPTAQVLHVREADGTSTAALDYKVAMDGQESQLQETVGGSSGQHSASRSGLSEDPPATRSADGTTVEMVSGSDRPTQQAERMRSSAPADDDGVSPMPSYASSSQQQPAPPPPAETTNPPQRTAPPAPAPRDVEGGGYDNKASSPPQRRRPNCPGTSPEIFGWRWVWWPWSWRW